MKQQSLKGVSKSSHVTKRSNHKLIQPSKQFKSSPGQDEASDCDGLCAAGRFKGSAGQDEASDCDLCAAGKVRRKGI